MSTYQSKKSTKKKKFEFPHVIVILFSITIIASILSYIIPAGEFDRVDQDGTMVVVEGTYQTVESNPPGLFDVFLSVPEGMTEGASIIFFILIVGGSFAVLLETRAIDAMMGRLTTTMQGKEIYVIPVFMILFAIGGATFGMSEEAIPFMLILVPLAIKMGFDSMTGAAIVLIGAHAGFTAAFINPFTVGVAQSIAGVPMFSGMGVRFVFWLIFVGISIAYVMIYANKVKKNPEISLMYEDDQKEALNEPETGIVERATKRHALIIGVLGLTLIGLALGVIFLDWYVNEIAALFFIMGLVVGLIGRLPLNRIADAFIKGCQDLALGALVVGFAYSILIILENSNTIDTILNFAANTISSWPGYLSAIGMFGIQSILNFIVPSGSGQAALTMPIMAPLADLVDVSRQTAVLAFQMGDGISNIVTPTSGAFMAALAVAKVPWVRWIKWILPLILIHYALGVIFVTIAHLFIW